jgi:glutamyl/glutaminyl-tRNA synthetase
MEEKSSLDQSVITSIANYLEISLPEINVIDFRNSGYLPEALVNFISLLGWSPGDDRQIMSMAELIQSFDINRLTKSNSLFDRQKLLAFNTEHIRMAVDSRILPHFRNYIEVIDSPVHKADDRLLLRIIKSCHGARTLADIDRKSRFLFVANDEIQYDEKAVCKVLLKPGALEILEVIRNKLAVMDNLTEEAIEDMLRQLAGEKKVGLGKVAQPLRVAICGNTISPPIFDSVTMLGRENTLTRIDNTIKRFKT